MDRTSGDGGGAATRGAGDAMRWLRLRLLLFETLRSSGEPGFDTSLRRRLARLSSVRRQPMIRCRMP